jgi:hypothetical protein
MSYLRSNLVVGVAATLAAMAYVTLRERMREQRMAAQAYHEVVWEGEGGNVPEVALENGNQGRSERVEVPAHAADVDERQSFPFPTA